MVDAVVIHGGATSQIVTGGSAVYAVYGPVLGGLLANPLAASDQGLSTAEPLYIDLVNPATLSETNTTFELNPGESYSIPANVVFHLSVNAPSSGHKFSIIVWQPVAPPPVLVPGDFPPLTPQSLQNVIPCYVYEEYNDDDDVEAFFNSANSIAQEYVDWFNQTNLPVYTGTPIFGALLDWVALGLYGIARPVLASSSNNNEGPFNTYEFNTLAFNATVIIGSQNVTVTTDDIFKRILTWALYRGDSQIVNIAWIKRRIVRFLNGANGTDPGIDNTYDVSVTFGAGNQVNITIPGGINASVLSQAIGSGAVELPFQFTYVVTIS